ncbi:uncharacterized protein [Vulpes vulpes]|uniref:Uncharacterized protein LOC112926298 isoform X1 n=1 Tax=Vulpes vulpes TaxID=9627 RepID=A0A3Q7TP92_VULVU|nr:uncharacterized protein LOC112926298 isoform X1 [Vulpes vulpes]
MRVGSSPGAGGRLCPEPDGEPLPACPRRAGAWGAAAPRAGRWEAVLVLPAGRPLGGGPGAPRGRPGCRCAGSAARRLLGAQGGPGRRRPRGLRGNGGGAVVRGGARASSGARTASAREPRGWLRPVVPRFRGDGGAAADETSCCSFLILVCLFWGVQRRICLSLERDDPPSADSPRMPPPCWRLSSACGLPGNSTDGRLEPLWILLTPWHLFLHRF